MPIGFNHNTESVNPSEDSVIEIGAIYGNARSTAPSGYLLCDGSAISRTTYARLFTIIGTTYGIGDGSTTFNIPDLRQAVQRGAGTNSLYANNVTVSLGSRIDDATQSHYHYASGRTPYGRASGAGYAVNASYHGGVDDAWSELTITTGRSATETRVKSLGVNFFIKF